MIFLHGVMPLSERKEEESDMQHKKGGRLAPTPLACCCN
jgi:hypothetical protein